MGTQESNWDQVDYGMITEGEHPELPDKTRYIVGQQ